MIIPLIRASIPVHAVTDDDADAVTRAASRLALTVSWAPGECTVRGREPVVHAFARVIAREFGAST